MFLVVMVMVLLSAAAAVSAEEAQTTIDQKFEFELVIEEGQALYFISDPNEHNWENTFWNIEILNKDTGEKFFFGDPEGPEVNTLPQGENGWFYMFSLLKDQGDSFPVDSFEQAVMGKSGYQAWGGPDQWMIPEEHLTLEDGKPAWWKVWFRFDGKTGLVAAGDRKTAALKWVAPLTGNYTLTGRFWGDVPADAITGNFGDRATFSIYKDTERLLSERFGLVYPEEPAEVIAEEPAEEPIENPETGDLGIPIGLVIAASFSGLAALALKRRRK